MMCGSLYMFDLGLSIHAADLCTLRRASHKKSPTPHFRFPLFLFIASTVSHNAQELPIYLGYPRLVGAWTRRTAKAACLSRARSLALSLSILWLVCVWLSRTRMHACVQTHTHTRAQTKPDTVGEYVAMPISPWQTYVRLYRRKKKKKSQYNKARKNITTPCNKTKWGSCCGQHTCTYVQTPQRGVTVKNVSQHFYFTRQDHICSTLLRIRNYPVTGNTDKILIFKDFRIT